MRQSPRGCGSKIDGLGHAYELSMPHYNAETSTSGFRKPPTNAGRTCGFWSMKAAM